MSHTHTPTHTHTHTHTHTLTLTHILVTRSHCLLRFFNRSVLIETVLRLAAVHFFIMIHPDSWLKCLKGATTTAPDWLDDVTLCLQCSFVMNTGYGKWWRLWTGSKEITYLQSKKMSLPEMLTEESLAYAILKRFYTLVKFQFLSFTNLFFICSDLEEILWQSTLPKPI